jgi:hypothetical protein
VSTRALLAGNVQQLQEIHLNEDLLSKIWRKPLNAHVPLSGATTYDWQTIYSLNLKPWSARILYVCILQVVLLSELRKKIIFPALLIWQFSSPNPQLFICRFEQILNHTLKNIRGGNYPPAPPPPTIARSCILLKTII